MVTADDFGMSPGISAGIARAAREGVVTATSAMVCQPGAVDELREAAASVPADVGLHLQLTDGIPCCDPSEVPSLVTTHGVFPRSWRDLGNVEPGEIRLEWTGQLHRLRAAGIEPTHLDTHHDVHRFPLVFGVYVDLALELGVPARTMPGPMTTRLRELGVPCTDAYVHTWYGGDLGIDSLLRRVNRAFARIGGRGVVEVACHPGHLDAALAARSRYVAERAEELRILCDPSLPGRLAESGITLTAPSRLGGPVAGDIPASPVTGA